MKFTKNYTSISDEQVEKLTREFNIYYRDCIGSSFYLLSIRVDLCFTVHKLEKFSANPGKVDFEGLVHILRYIRNNKTLGLKFYADLNDSPLFDLFRQANIEFENHLMDFSDSSCKDRSETVRITGAYIIFYQGGPIDH